MAFGLTLGTAQVSSEETEVVQGKDPLVELLLLLSEDTGNLLRELNKVSQLCQLLTDPTDTGRKRAAAGHTVGQLTLSSQTAASAVEMLL